MLYNLVSQYVCKSLKYLWAESQECSDGKHAHSSSGKSEKMLGDSLELLTRANIVRAAVFKECFFDLFPGVSAQARILLL